MLSETRLKKLVKEKEAYLTMLEELDRTGKLKKAHYKERVNFTIDGNIINQFRKSCNTNDIKMSTKIETLIKDYLKKSN
tara:strand:+ start:1364 stop:1600 length:237 start_codon:yes stop_codon:yes gene_type:complete